MVDAWRAERRCAQVIEFGRSRVPALDLSDAASIERAATELAKQGPFH